MPRRGYHRKTDPFTLAAAYAQGHADGLHDPFTYCNPYHQRNYLAHYAAGFSDALVEHHLIKELEAQNAPLIPIATTPNNTGE